MDTLKELFNCAGYITKRYFGIYKTTILNNALDLEDLIQEADIVIWKILSNDNYKDKSMSELKKIVNAAVGYKMEEIKNKAFKHYQKIEHINLKRSENDVDYLDSININKSKPERPNLLFENLKEKRICTPKEYDLLIKRFAKEMTYREIGEEYSLTKGRIHQKLKKVLKKLKKRAKLF